MATGTGGSSSLPPSPPPSPSPSLAGRRGHEGEEERERDFRHTCGLCMEPYRGRSPKLLPCFHTFCLPCLTALHHSAVTSAARHQPHGDVTEDADATLLKSDGTDAPQAGAGGEGGEGGVMGSSDPPEGFRGQDVVTGDDMGKVTFPCPTCRAPVVVPEGGVASLQANFYIDYDNGVDCNTPAVLCDMCEDANRQHASHACQECHLNVCRTCRRYHDILARDHHVTPLHLGPLMKGSGREVKGRGLKGQGHCLVHQDQALCFHCRRCDVTICLQCRVTSHEGHDTSELMSAIQEAKADIASLIPVAQHQLQILDSAVRQVEQESRQLSRYTQKMTQDVMARHEALVMWAARSRDQLVEELRVREAEAAGELSREKSSLTLTSDSLASLLTRAAPATSTDPRVVMARKDLRSALLDHDDLKRLQERAGAASPRGPAWDWSYDVTDADVVQEDDVRAYMGRVVGEREGGGGEVDRLPVSLRELADRVDCWMNQTTEVSNSLASKLTSCHNDVTQLQTEKADMSMTNDLTSKLTSCQSDVSQCKNEVTNLLKDKTEMVKKTTALRGELTSLRKYTVAIPKGIADATFSFHAKDLNMQNTKQGEAAIFGQVTTNKKGHFDAQTGTFAAPERGIYVFGATVETLSQDSYDPMHIMVGTRCHLQVKGDYRGNSGCLVVSLNKGDPVWLKAVRPGGHYYSRFTTFSGLCISQM